MGGYPKAIVLPRMSHVTLHLTNTCIIIDIGDPIRDVGTRGRAPTPSDPFEFLFTGPLLSGPIRSGTAPEGAYASLLHLG